MSPEVSNPCPKCKGKGCRKCDHLGRVLREGFVLCPECEGFCTIGFDPNDPLDMGSFEESCPTCKAMGAIHKAETCHHNKRK